MDRSAFSVASALAAGRFSTTALVVPVRRLAYLVDALELRAECAGDRADCGAEPGERRVRADPRGVAGVVFEDTAFYEQPRDPEEKHEHRRVAAEHRDAQRERRRRVVERCV